MGKAAGADALAEMGNGLFVAEKILEAHGLSLEQGAVWWWGAKLELHASHFDQTFQNINAARKTRASSVLRTVLQSRKTCSASRTSV